MANFIQRRRRDQGFNRALTSQAKQPKSNISENLILVAITIFAIHYIFKIQYLELLGTLIAVAAAMNKGHNIGQAEGFEKGYNEGFDKGVE